MRQWAMGMLVLLSACGGGSGGGHTLTGTMDLRVSAKTMQIFRSGAIGHAASFAVGQPCKASEYAQGYSDLDEGSSIVVKNETDTVIATGRLGAGHWTEDACETPFSVTSVPDASFYSVEVGHRGAQRYSKAEMEKAKWAISLSVTDSS